MYTYFITEPTIKNRITAPDTVAFTWVASDYGLESRQTCVSGFWGAYELTSTGMKSCLLLRLLTALKSDEGDLRKWGVSHTEATIRLSIQSNINTQFPEFSPRPTNPNGLLVSSLTKTSQIEIHDHTPVNVASLFFKLLQTLTGLTTFLSFALNPT